MGGLTHKCIFHRENGVSRCRMDWAGHKKQTKHVLPICANAVQVFIHGRRAASEGK